MRSLEENIATPVMLHFLNMMSPIVIVSGINSCVFDKVSANVSKSWCI